MSELVASQEHFDGQQHIIKLKAILHSRRQGKSIFYQDMKRTPYSFLRLQVTQKALQFFFFFSTVVLDRLAKIFCACSYRLLLKTRVTTEHVSSRVSRGEFKTKEKKLKET